MTFAYILTVIVSSFGQSLHRIRLAPGVKFSVIRWKEALELAGTKNEAEVALSNGSCGDVYGVVNLRYVPLEARRV